MGARSTGNGRAHCSRTASRIGTGTGEDARRIIGLRQDRIDALTAELGNVRTQWNRMRIAKEQAEAKNAVLEARL